MADTTGAEKPQIDLSALEAIAEDFLRWRRWMILPAIGVVVLAWAVLVLTLNSDALHTGKGILLPICGPFLVFWVAWYFFKGRAQKRVITKALPLIASVSGVNSHEPDRYTSMRVKKAGRSGLFPAHKATCEYSLSCRNGDILMTMDQFATVSGHHNGNRFGGYLFKTDSAIDTPDLLVCMMGNKTDLPEKLAEPVRIGSELFEIWYREDAGAARVALQKILPRIRRTADHLTDDAQFHGLMIRDGFLTLAVQHDNPYFNFHPLTANKATLLERFSSWLTICTLPLRIAAIWHADSRKPRPEA